MAADSNDSADPGDTGGATTDINPSQGMYDAHSGRPATTIGEWADTALSRYEPHGQAMIDGARNAWNNPGEAISAMANGVGDAISNGASDAWDHISDLAIIGAGPAIVGQDRWNQAAGGRIIAMGEDYAEMDQTVDELLAVYDEDGAAGLSGELIGRYGAEAAGGAAAGPLGGKLGSLLKGVSMTAKGQKLKKLVDKVVGPKKKPEKKGDKGEKKDTGAFIGAVSATDLVDAMLANKKIKIGAGQDAGKVRARLIRLARTKQGYETLSRIANGKHSVIIGIVEWDGLPARARAIYDENGPHYGGYSAEGRYQVAPALGEGDPLGRHRGPNGEWVDTDDAFIVKGADPLDPPVLITGRGAGTPGEVIVSLTDPDEVWLHELGHAANGVEGVNANHLLSFNDELDPTAWPLVRMEEVQNINLTENPYRAEVGLPLRNGHAHVPDRPDDAPGAGSPVVMHDDLPDTVPRPGTIADDIPDTVPRPPIDDEPTVPYPKTD